MQLKQQMEMVMRNETSALELAVMLLLEIDLRKREEPQDSSTYRILNPTVDDDAESHEWHFKD